MQASNKKRPGCVPSYQPTNQPTNVSRKNHSSSERTAPCSGRYAPCAPPPPGESAPKTASRTPPSLPPCSNPPGPHRPRPRPRPRPPRSHTPGFVCIRICIRIPPARQQQPASPPPSTPRTTDGDVTPVRVRVCSSWCLVSGMRRKERETVGMHKGRAVYRRLFVVYSSGIRLFECIVGRAYVRTLRRQAGGRTSASESSRGLSVSDMAGAAAVVLFPVLLVGARSGSGLGSVGSGWIGAGRK